MTRVMLFILLFPLCGYSQVQVKGIVKDHLYPVTSANVMFTNIKGELIAGSVTDKEGSFLITVKPGVYKAKISFLGFAGWEKEVLLEKDTDLGIIILEEDAANLKGITVSAKPKMITYKPDRMVFNVENSISAIGGNALNAIGAAPGVIFKNNSIDILGKGTARVMVNGRMIELSGEDLVNYLNSIPSGDISNIEIITNPPARYEAAGGGLINIILKKGISDTWKNSTTLAYDQNKYNFFTLRDNFLYNKNKVKFSFSGGGSLGNTGIKQDLTTYYPTGPWELSYLGKEKKDNVSGRIAFDYELSKKTTVGIQYLSNYNNSGSRDNTSIDIFNTAHQLDSLLKNSGHRDQHADSHTYNAHFLSVLDTLNRKINVDFDYFTYDSKISNDLIAKTFLPDMTFLNTNLAVRNVSGQKISNYSVKADMEHPLKFIHLSYGAKLSFTDSNGDLSYYQTITGAPELDPGRSNEFRYKEKNQAIYLSGMKNLGSRLSFQLGLRAENTQTNGYSATLNQVTQNDYLKLFPTFYISYQQNEHHNFLFNYGKRIDRPGFGTLNPFRSYINSNSYSEGNPFLKPSFSNNFDFTHTYKGKLRSNLFLNITTDGSGPVFTSDPATRTLIITRQNYYKEYYYGIGETYSTGITSWWQSQNTAYLMGSKSEFTGSINAKPKNGMQLYIATTNTFSLGESTRLQADYFYSSPYKKGLYAFGYMSGLNIAVKQSLLRKQVQLSLLVNDIFNTAYLKDYTSIVNGIKQVYNENNSSRFFRLSLTYNFGNDRVSVKQRDFGNDEERKRAN